MVFGKVWARKNALMEGEGYEGGSAAGGEGTVWGRKRAGVFANVEKYGYDVGLRIDLGSGGACGVDGGILEMVLSKAVGEALSSLFTFDGGMKAQEEE